MKNRAVVALFVAFLLTVSALAQQSTAPATTDQSAPAASSSNSTDSASGKAPLQYETRQGFWGKVNPFARKKYVQKQLTPIQNRVNELDELTAANSKMIKDVDSRAQQGIQMASNKANEADQHAVDAGNKATAAQDTAMHPAVLDAFMDGTLGRSFAGVGRGQDLSDVGDPERRRAAACGIVPVDGAGDGGAYAVGSCGSCGGGGGGGVG